MSTVKKQPSKGYQIFGAIFVYSILGVVLTLAFNIFGLIFVVACFVRSMIDIINKTQVKPTKVHHAK